MRVFLDMAADSPIHILSGTHGILLNGGIDSVAHFVNGWDLKGVLHPQPEISMLCALSQNYQHLSEKWYMHYNLSKPIGAWVIDQNNILIVLIYNLNHLIY